MTRAKFMVLIDAWRRGIVSFGDADEAREALEELQRDGYLTFGLIEGGQEAEVDLTNAGQAKLEEFLARICDA